MVTKREHGIWPSGVTLVEMMVVIAIIALLLGLIMPAIHFARERARRTTCESNLHQLGIAVTHYVELRKKLPAECPDGEIGGWAIEILPFMEDGNLYDGLSAIGPLDPSAPPELARKRPFLMTCPSAYEGDSSVATVPASHYSGQFDRKTGHVKWVWRIGEVPTNCRIPWVSSPEVPFGGSVDLRPHRGGYNYANGSGATAHGVFFNGPDD
jgi:prepilin-type N-terminal cleavage/methylation domain-containing protein